MFVTDLFLTNMFGSALPPTRSSCPPCLANRGFTAGLLIGLAFFAAVNGLAYVIALFFQTALGLTTSATAIALSPLMADIIVSSIVCRPLVAKLGRVLVVIGLGITLAGAAGLCNAAGDSMFHPVPGTGLPGLIGAEGERQADGTVGPPHLLLRHAETARRFGEGRPAAGSGGDEAVHGRGQRARRMRGKQPLVMVGDPSPRGQGAAHDR